MAKLRIALTGGGSGGHIYPLLAVTEELQKLASEKNEELNIVYLGPRDAFAALLHKSGIRRHSVLGAKLRGYSTIQNVLDIPKFFIGLIQAFWHLFWLMPDVIFSKGGTGAFPVVFAGWFYRIPVLLHESDAIPGVTNILSSRFAARIALGFSEATRYFDPARTAVVGNPVRPWLLAEKPDSSAAKKALGFKPDQPLLLILGGSQGSRRINEFIITHLPLICKEAQVLHQTGAGNFTEIESLSRAALGASAGAEAPYKAVPYLDEELKNALAAADCIAARAGAGALTEAAAFGKPMILIPLAESAHDHQLANAHSFEKAGGGVLIEEENLFVGIFIGAMKKIMSNPQRYAAMSAASRAFFKPDAAQVLAREILLLAESNR
ncbi:MAG: UDP-N-acetylglucosamine--N-acetylmuramyl-(pentapeptide) pyrophosphoryl-undecaprenol N-acetylglucosamine transferase [Candidatus Liptonbacteria bacterium]|nr:UDP-N-acetylglucosamine--N-acetylmuramyl-(pentapeptide) pyrophosphoryl-undecaprenol N-acetylglucosamine transferase [Candidatus Liptonbacteria bacterium]